MKKIINKKIVIGFLLGVIVTLSISVVAYSYKASDISYTPKDKDKKEKTVQEAINDLKNSSGGSSKVKYKNMTIEYDKNSNKFRYYYNDKEIYPIYWYGYIPNSNIIGTFSTWNEANVSPNYTLNDDYLAISHTISSDNYCVGGVITNYKVNLSDYSSYHAYIKDTNITNYGMQYVSNQGYLGYNYSLNENGYGTVINENDKEFVTDISGVSGYYFIGFTNRCGAGNLNVNAMWLEK